MIMFRYWVNMLGWLIMLHKLFENFRENMSSGKRIVSFDFDDTLTNSWDNSARYDTSIDVGLNQTTLAKVRQHLSQGDKVIIVTARSDSPDSQRDVEDFLRHFQIPIDEVHYTNGDLKASTLVHLGASMHYDDDEDEINELQRIAPDITPVRIPSGIEDPRNKDMPVRSPSFASGLEESELSEAGKSARTLWHIGPRPAKPKMRVGRTYDRGTEWEWTASPGWYRHKLGDKAEIDVPAVFLSDNPHGIAMNHGRVGNVYAYSVPEWVIKESGGMQRFDWGSEIVIREETWNKAWKPTRCEKGKHICFLGSKDKETFEKELKYRERDYEEPSYFKMWEKIVQSPRKTWEAKIRKLNFWESQKIIDNLKDWKRKIQEPTTRFEKDALDFEKMLKDIYNKEINKK